MTIEFAKDFIQAQGEIQTLPKDKKGYGYKYTDFDTVLTAIKPILAKHNLGFMQLLQSNESGQFGLKTIIIHTSGESIEAFTILPHVTAKGMNEAQSLGSAITYMKRYALCAALGVSSDEDVDAQNLESQGQNQEPRNNQQNNATVTSRNGPQKQQSDLQKILNDYHESLYKMTLQNGQVYGSYLEQFVGTTQESAVINDVINYLISIKLWKNN